MEPLTTGAQQLISLTCGAMFLAWFALTIVSFLTRVVIDRLRDWID